MINPINMSHSNFRAYANAPKFRQIYQPNPQTQRLTNVFSATHKPLVLGEPGDFTEHKLRSLSVNNLFSIDGRPLYCVDYDGITAYAVQEAYELGVIDKGATLVRFDAHPDAEKSVLETGNISLERCFNSHSSKFSENRFLWYLVQQGYINEIIWFSSSPGFMFINGPTEPLTTAFPHLKFTRISENGLRNTDKNLAQAFDSRKLILNVDLDYFENLPASYLFSVSTILLQFLRRASTTVVAFSPDYIPAEKASRFLIDMVSNI